MLRTLKIGIDWQKVQNQGVKYETGMRFDLFKASKVNV